MKTCGDAFAAAEPEDSGSQDALAILSGARNKEQLASLQTALPAIKAACAEVDTTLTGAAGLKGKHDLLDGLLELGSMMTQTLAGLDGALGAEDDQQKARALGLAQQAQAIANEVASEHEQLVDSPGRKSIGFVCAGKGFCPFPATTPMIPPELDGVIGQKNPFATQVVQGMKQMEDRINGILGNIQRNLFHKRGFNIVQVDLEDDIAQDVAALVLLGPTDTLTQWELYAVDQFVMRGGSLVVMLNPWDVSILNLNEQGEMNVSKLEKNSANIGELLAAWGIGTPGSLIAEPKSHDTITVLSLIRQGQLMWQTQRAFPYPLLPIFTVFNDTSPLVRAVSSLSLPWTTELSLTSVPGVEHVALVSSSTEALTVTDPAFALEPGAQLAAVGSMSGGSERVVAATATGELPSYFAGKDAPAKPAKPSKEGEDADEDNELVTSRDKKLDKGPGRVLVIGSNLGLEDLSRDTIFEGFDLGALTGQDFTIIDKFKGWGARLQNWEVRLGQIQHTLGDNIQFLFNVLDWSILKEALVEIRSKQYQRRPLEQLDEGQQSMVRLTAIVGAPLLFIVFGVLRFFMRRRRRLNLKV